MFSKELYSFVKVQAPSREVFLYFFSTEPLEIFKGTYFIANVIPGSIKNGSAQLGSEQSLHFKNGTRAKHELLNFTSQVCFSVRIYDFTHNSFLALQSVQYNFSFTSEDKKMTKVHCELHLIWSYRISFLIYKVFCHRLLQRKLDQFLIQTAKEVKIFINWKLKLD